MNRIGIIGGGASGIVAAIAAARSDGDAQVFILEQKENIGKKILATGNGRCNLTNEAMDASCYHGEDPEFARNVLKQFGYGRPWNSLLPWDFSPKAGAAISIPARIRRPPFWNCWKWNCAGRR